MKAPRLVLERLADADFLGTTGTIFYGRWEHKGKEYGCSVATTDTMADYLPKDGADMVGFQAIVNQYVAWLNTGMDSDEYET